MNEYDHAEGEMSELYFSFAEEFHALRLGTPLNNYKQQYPSEVDMNSQKNYDKENEVFKTETDSKERRMQLGGVNPFAAGLGGGQTSGGSQEAIKPSIKRYTREVRRITRDSVTFHDDKFSSVSPVSDGDHEVIIVWYESHTNKEVINQALFLTLETAYRNAIPKG